MSYDVYSDGVLKSTKHVFCNCCEDEKHATCFGCGKCYMQLLENYNKQREMESKKAKHVWPDFEDQDAFILAQPSFGVLRWFCSMCEHILCEQKNVNSSVSEKVSSNVVPVNDDSAVTKLQKDFALMNDKLDDLVTKIAQSHAAIDLTSPPRKFARYEWADLNSNEPTRVTTTSQLPVERNFTLQNPVKNDFIINVKSKDSAPSTGSIFRTMHENKGAMPDFCGRKKFNGSHDLIFKSYSDACSAKLVLDSKLKNCNIGDPKLDKLVRYNLVGFEYDMTPSEVADYLVQENKWLNLEKCSNSDTVQVKGDPKCTIIVKKVSKCRNISSYMCNLLMSPNMEAKIGLNKLIVGYMRCKLYKQNGKLRCYRCQHSDHFAADCKNKLCCPRCSLEHRAEDCDSTILKCINCVRGSKSDINHPVYSLRCPYNSPNT